MIHFRDQKKLFDPIVYFIQVVSCFLYKNTLGQAVSFDISIGDKVYRNLRPESIRGSEQIFEGLTGVTSESEREKFLSSSEVRGEIMTTLSTGEIVKKKYLLKNDLISCSAYHRSYVQKTNQSKDKPVKSVNGITGRDEISYPEAWYPARADYRLSESIYTSLHDEWRTFYKYIWVDPETDSLARSLFRDEETYFFRGPSAKFFNQRRKALGSVMVEDGLGGQHEVIVLSDEDPAPQVDPVITTTTTTIEESGGDYMLYLRGAFGEGTAGLVGITPFKFGQMLQGISGVPLNYRTVFACCKLMAYLELNQRGLIPTKVSGTKGFEVRGSNVYVDIERRKSSHYTHTHELDLFIDEVVDVNPFIDQIFNSKLSATEEALYYKVRLHPTALDDFTTVKISGSRTKACLGHAATYLFTLKTFGKIYYWAYFAMLDLLFTSGFLYRGEDGLVTGRTIAPSSTSLPRRRFAYDLGPLSFALTFSNNSLICNPFFSPSKRLSEIPSGYYVLGYCVDGKEDYGVSNHRWASPVGKQVDYSKSKYVGASTPFMTMDHFLVVYVNHEGIRVIYDPYKPYAFPTGTNLGYKWRLSSNKDWVKEFLDYLATKKSNGFFPSEKEWNAWDKLPLPQLRSWDCKYEFQGRAGKISDPGIDFSNSASPVWG